MLLLQAQKVWLIGKVAVLLLSHLTLALNGRNLDDLRAEWRLNRFLGRLLRKLDTLLELDKFVLGP